MIYLNSFDYIAAFLAWLSRNTPARENLFTVALTLDADLQTREIRPILDNTFAVAPWFSGEMTRHPWHRAPAWQLGQSKLIPIEVLSNKMSYNDALLHANNTPMPSPCRIALSLLHGVGRSHLFFKFSHQLFDGRGAELFLNKIRVRTPQILSDTPGWTSPHLNDWKNQFLSGRAVQRYYIRMAEKRPILTLRGADDAENIFDSISLDEAQTKALYDRSDREAGPFMQTPYFQAISAVSLARALADGADDAGQGNFVVPMTVDLRGQEDIPANAILFNCWSMLPLCVERSALNSLPDAVTAFRNAFFAAMSEHLPTAFRHASFLARIAPFSLMNKLLLKFHDLLEGTFMFSYVNHSSLPSNEFGSARITALTHYPTMPPHPGLGIFFSLFNHRLTVVVSMRRGVLTGRQTSCLKQNLEHFLKGETP